MIAVALNRLGVSREVLGLAEVFAVLGILCPIGDRHAELLEAAPEMEWVDVDGDLDIRLVVKVRGAVFVDRDRRDLVVDHGTTTGRILDTFGRNRRTRRCVAGRIGDVLELLVTRMELGTAHAERSLRRVALGGCGLDRRRATRDRFGAGRGDDRSRRSCRRARRTRRRSCRWAAAMAA